MSKIMFDRDGYPLAVTSHSFFAISAPKRKLVTETVDQRISLEGHDFIQWGPTNHYPDDAQLTIGKTGVLQTAIGFKCRTSFGQGVVARKHQGYDADGDELMVPYTDNPAVQQFLDGQHFRNYCARAFRDLYKFGNAFPIFYFNAEGKIVSIIARNARHCRMSDDKRFLLVYPDFAKHSPSEGEKNYEIIPMLDEDDPITDLLIRRQNGTLNTSRPIAFPRIQNYFSNNDYYGLPDWEAANESGWIEVANFVPQFLLQSYRNALSMMYHIQIPRRWYKERFPESDYATCENPKEARESDIQSFFDDLEASLSGTDNASASLLSEYGDEDGLGEDKWIIDRIENEIDAKERLNTSAAANSEILFSMMINPSTLGAGMPGGSYAGNAGSGSDIRESYLVSVVTTYVEKQQVLDPVRLMFAFNGESDELRLKYKDTILTTLNTGNSQETVTQ